ncbi:MAG: hypothetical protein HQ515_00670 [Phycisphaeraceae bacterium]|nr:hypothetical protein [Phycisphaeraceae bacterium]
MQNILAKIGAFFEAHVEKFVLAVSGIVGLWLLMMFVVMSPNKVTYDKKTFSPGSIDGYINENKARLVLNELNQSSTASAQTYVSILDGSVDVNDDRMEGFGNSLPEGFLGLLSCSIDHIESGAGVRVVSKDTPVIKTDGRQYALPYVGGVSQVQVEHIRAAAYLPAEPVSDENTYQSVDHDVNDVDLVTVQARFDTASLRERFYESFAGGGLPAAWQDDVMAKPVFAAVHLQRQEQLTDGSWTPWSDVRQIATLPQTETYSAIEKASELPAGGIRVRMIRLNEETVRTNILQAPAYEMATTYEEWLPPEFHGKYQVERQKEEAAKRREERDAERESNRDTNSSRGRQRPGMNNQQGAGGRNNIGGMGNETGRRSRRGNNATGNDRNALPGGRGGATTGRGRGGTRGNQRGGADDLYGGYGAMPGGRGGLLGQVSALEKVFEAFEEIRLNPMEEFTRLDEIVFWSHDDSMDPGKIYRYRIRLGVLNPVAGLGYVSQKDIAFKDQVILWSDFSTQTEPVEIPERLYFFANTFQAASSAVSVEVAKFDNGYWRSSIFSVKPGETIGRVVEIEPEEDERQNQYNYPGARGGMGLAAPEPEMIDFSTNTVFVASERVNKWIGNKTLRSQVSDYMLYSDNGMDIQRIPIGSKNWPERLKTAYGIVKRLQKEPIEDFRSFGSSRTSSNSMGLGGQMGVGMGLYGR